MKSAEPLRELYLSSTLLEDNRNWQTLLKALQIFSRRFYPLK